MSHGGTGDHDHHAYDDLFELGYRWTNMTLATVQMCLKQAVTSTSNPR